MSDTPPVAGKIAPSVALALLESVRAADRPHGEVPAETDLHLALRRRLGMSRVVEEQIRRYAGRRDRDAVAAQEVAQLFELIGRRPDARDLFAAAGHRLVALHLGEQNGVSLPVRILPASARHRLALRRVRRIARYVNPGSPVALSGRPAALTVHRCLPARALAGDEGCAILEGVIQAVLERYRAGPAVIVHAACEGRADDRCLWRLEPGEEAAGDPAR